MTTTRPTAIITGAGGGIGSAACRRLVEAGYALCAIGRTQQTLTDALAHAGGGPHMHIVADQAVAGEPARAARAAIETLGHIDVLINNAAALINQPLADTTRPDLEALFAANVFGPVEFITALWPHFVERRAGAMINISSMATIDPFPGLGVYAATKTALESVTRSIMNEAADTGIRAWSIAPGAVETAMLRQVVSADDLPEAQTLTPDDIARVIVECATGARDHQAGEVITVPNG